MLPKEYRIPRKLFSEFKTARTRRNDLFLLRIADHNSKRTRICFSVSKKIAKNAVQRNKLRRIAYNLIKPYLGKIKDGKLILFQYVKNEKDTAEIKNKLESIINDSLL